MRNTVMTAQRSVSTAKEAAAEETYQDYRLNLLKQAGASEWLRPTHIKITQAQLHTSARCLNLCEVFLDSISPVFTSLCV